MSNVAQIKIQLSNGQEAGKTINELTGQSAKFAREIKKMEVGSEDFVRVSEDFKKVSSRLKDVKKEAFDTAQAQENLNSMFKDMIPFQAEFGKLATGIKGAGAAIKLTTGLTNLFKLALAATGIGLVVIGLASLVAWLRKTQAGMDFVGKVTAAAGAAFSVIIDRALAFGSAMANIATGNFGAAVDDLTKTFSGLGKELKNETAAAYQMEGAMQDIVRAEKQIEVQKSRSRAEIEKLKMLAEDQTKSEQERLNAAQSAFAIENKLLGDSIALQEKKLKTIQDQNAQGTSTDEDRNKEFDVEIELNNMREESFTKQTELQNKINELKRSGVVVSKEVAEKEIEIIEENLDKEIEALGAQIGRQLENEKMLKEEKAKLKEEALNGRMEAMDKEFEMEQMKLQEQFFTGQLTEDELKQAAFENEKAFLEQRLAELAMFGVTEQEQYQELYTQLAALHYDYNAEKQKSDEQYAAAKISLEKQAFDAALESFNAVIGWLERDEKAKRKNFVAVKAMRLAELTVSSISEVQDIWRYANANPINAVFPGAAQVLAGVKTTAAVVRYATGVSKITSAKFAEGGVVKGPSHQAGGIKFSAGGQMNEMEGDEIILTKGVYQSPVLRSMASELNVMGGGRSFALGGPVLQDRSFINTASQSSAGMSGQAPGQAAGMDVRNLEEIMLRIESNTRVTAEKPVLAVTQIREKLQMLQDTEQDAQF